MSSIKSKRRAMKLMAGAGLTAVITEKWGKPIMNQVILPAHAQTSVANRAPVGESFTADAFGDSAVIVDLAPRISDPDGDAITVTVVDSRVLGGGLSISDVSLVPTSQISVSVTNGSGEIFVDYQLSDGQAVSPVYRITITNLDGPLA